MSVRIDENCERIDELHKKNSKILIQMRKPKRHLNFQVLTNIPVKIVKSFNDWHKSNKMRKEKKNVGFGCRLYNKLNIY